MLGSRFCVLVLALAGAAHSPVPPVRAFAQTYVRRWPGVGDTWARATLELHFDVEPKVGQEITVVPLGVPLAPFHLPIRKIEGQEFETCEDRKIETIYSVETDDLPNPAILTLPALPNRRGEFPFDAAVIYPAVRQVQVIPPARLLPALLPKGVAASQVTLALDLNRDRAPDLLIVTYDTGDLTTEDYYQRGNGVWRRVKHLVPC